MLMLRKLPYNGQDGQSVRRPQTLHQMLLSKQAQYIAFKGLSVKQFDE